MICPRCGSEMAVSGPCARCAALRDADATVRMREPLVADDGTVAVPRLRTGSGSAPAHSDDGGATVMGFDSGAETQLAGSSRPLSSESTGIRSAHRTPPAAGKPIGPLAVGQAFGSRYHIIRALGAGGMGAVYQAWDAELEVAVAIKVIRPDVMADGRAAAEVERRFKRELLLARQVTHKNVVRIHDLGEIDGIKYITMSYVEGADLATSLKRDETPPLPVVMRLAREVVSGLVEAHKAGVVHRDLKPANIMIDRDGGALIMDFGIARSSGQPAGGTVGGMLPGGLQDVALAANATMDGVVVGTLEYMAPEQARGQEVDQRADIYSFGLILYDLFAGHRRSRHAESAIAELQARMVAPPPSLKSIVPDVPDAVDRLIARCLETDPANRFQTTQELADALAELDDAGVPIPRPARFSAPMIAAAVALMLALVAATWWFTRTPPAAKAHDPVTVIIADFQNATGDSTFDYTLEQTLRRALEGAGFISAYDRSRIRATFGIAPPPKLDETAARELGVKQGVGAVVSGSIKSRGSGYEISVRATQTATGAVIVDEQGRASNKDQVLAAAAQLATTVRRGLGDQTSGSAQLLGMQGLTTSSLQAVSHYAAAVDAQSKGRYDEARLSFLQAIAVDPQFGLAYQGLAAASKTLGRLQDAEKYAKEALRYIDGMTERERFATRGNYYRMSGDYAQCVREYGELIARYSADTVAHNNRAVCLAKLRDMPGAVEEMRQAVRILPHRVTYRANLALFADYAGDFATAEREILAMSAPDAHGVAALALSQLGQGRVRDAAATYQRLAKMNAWGASFSSAGLGDLALYEGRFAEAKRILEEGAAADLVAKNADAAAMKFAHLAYVNMTAGDRKAARAAADTALLNSQAVAIRFLTARVFVEAGAAEKAADLADKLASELAAESQAYGKIVQGEIALKNKDARQAVKIFTEATGILDTWLGHFGLGRAYLELGAFPQADSEFDRCIKRRGEALSLLDEDPTYGYLPPVYYYLGRVREGLKTAGFAESYREYLKIRGSSTEDPLLPEIRKRAGG